MSSQQITRRGDAPLPATRADVAKHALDFGKAWEYAPAPEASDHVNLQKRYELFIGGKWRAPKSGKYFATTAPSTEEKLADVAEGGADDVDDAVKAARHAY